MVSEQHDARDSSRVPVTHHDHDFVTSLMMSKEFEHDPCIQEYLDLVSEVANFPVSLLVDLLKRQCTNVESLLTFYTLQRWIRDIVGRLTMDEASLALQLFCDTSLLVGRGLLDVQPQFRQTWVLELFRRLCCDRSKSLILFGNGLRSSQGKAEQCVVVYDIMGRLYGKLTTVLDHQYRIQLNQNPSKSDTVSGLHIQPLSERGAIIHETDSDQVTCEELDSSQSVVSKEENSFHSTGSVDEDSDHSFELE